MSLHMRRRDQRIEVKPDEMVGRAREVFIKDRQESLGWSLNQMGKAEVKKLAHVKTPFVIKRLELGLEPLTATPEVRRQGSWFQLSQTTRPDHFFGSILRLTIPEAKMPNHVSLICRRRCRAALTGRHFQ